eukprot:s1426_g26.t1
MFDVRRRLELTKSSKAFVQRRNFNENISKISQVSAEDLLKATLHCTLRPCFAEGCPASRRPWELHLQQHGVAQFESCSLNLDREEAVPELPDAAAMRRVIAQDPVAQARFFELMMSIFFEELLGIVPPFRCERYLVGLARTFEDGMATSLRGSIVGDIAALCGPLETQGSLMMSCFAVGYDLL